MISTCGVVLFSGVSHGLGAGQCSFVLRESIKAVCLRERSINARTGVLGTFCCVIVLLSDMVLPRVFYLIISII